MAGLTTAKLLFHSVISHPSSWFIGLDVSNFHLKTKFTTKDQYEYMYISAWTIPGEIMDQYNLHDKIHNGRVLAEIQMGMYRLPQAGRLAYEKVIKHRSPRFILAHYKTSPVQSSSWWLWSEIQRQATCATLDWHAEKALWDHCWLRRKFFCSIHPKWDYYKHAVELSLLGYVDKALTWFSNHYKAITPEHSPHKWNKPQYGSHQ